MRHLRHAAVPTRIVDPSKHDEYCVKAGQGQQQLVETVLREELHQELHV